jgi:hypothetical protein
MCPPIFARQAEALKKSTAHAVQYIPEVEEQPNLGRVSRQGKKSPLKAVYARKSKDNNSASSPKGLQDFPFLPSPEPKDFTESFMNLITCRYPNRHNSCNAPLGTSDREDYPLEISFIPIVSADSSIGGLAVTTYEMEVSIARSLRNLDLAEQEVVGKLALTRGGKKPSSMHKGGPVSNKDSTCHDTARTGNYLEEFVHEPLPSAEAVDIAQAKQTAKTIVGGGIRGLNLVGSRQLPTVNDEALAHSSCPMGMYSF